MFATALLVCPCRTSFIAVVEEASLEQLVQQHNSGGDDDSLALYRPWRLAAQRKFATREEAERCACAVSAGSGVRARVRALKAYDDEAHVHRRACVSGEFADPRRSLDGLTYVRAEFLNAERPQHRTGPVRLLVDTGSTDCELPGSQIEALKLRPVESALFETAAGITMQAPVYRATVQVLGREADVLLGPAELDEDDEESEEEREEGEEDFDVKFGFEKVSDEGLLGHDALAALGFAVDCRRRELVPLPTVANAVADRVAAAEREVEGREADDSGGGGTGSCVGS